MVYVNLLIGLGIATVVAFAYFNWNTPSSRRMLLNDRRIERSPEDLCTICLDPLSGLTVSLRCKHALHKKCFYQYLVNGGRQCPVCRRKIDV
ncbi:tripartite motif-containing protein 40 [Drosophila sechellia]|uniref:GM23930 n=1 Tax=Drosophila sechellia TaxID=7238 RepID=B4HIB8_DROSE|nr:tripartite motif-containing protein 40 [Drosophila sechellia]EDW42633.1 GM23930 [Drosophila sechellia]